MEAALATVDGDWYYRLGQLPSHSHLERFSAYPARQAFWFDPGLETPIATAERTPHRGLIQLSDHIDQAPIMFAFFSQVDPRIYREYGISGAGATVGQVGEKQFPPRTVIVAKPDEKVMDADLLQTITQAGVDRWGNPTQSNVYKVWLTR